MFSNIAARSFNYVIEQLGIPATYKQVASGNTKTIKVGFSSVQKDDTEIVNAYGINAKVITLKASDGIIPSKFDKISLHGETYVGEGHIPIHCGNDVIGYKIYIRGQ